MPVARLVTIPFSHYCEKARWTLDATGLPYREEPYAPVVHLWATRRLGGRTVPILVSGGETFKDSTDIARHADALAAPERRLLPENEEERQEVWAIEDELDETLGKDGRLLAYHYVLSDEALARAFVGRAMRLASPVGQRIATPLFRRAIFRTYGVTPERAQEAEARVRSTFARMGERLGGRGYLVGDRFTLADLTLATFGGLLLAPPEHPVMGKSKATPSARMLALREELTPTPAGQHVLRMYREHRAPPAPSA